MKNNKIKELRIVLISNGVEILIEEKRIPALLREIRDTRDGCFCDINGELVNPKDIVGIFKQRQWDRYYGQL